MPHPSLSSRVLDVLLHQDGGCDPEVRTLSLKTLIDDDRLSTMALFWTQVGWFWALWVTGWSWILACVAIDLILFAARWRLRRGLTPRGRALDATSQDQSAWINLLLVALTAADIGVLTQAPSERTAILAIMLALGFSGYIAALFSAFPIWRR